MTITGERKVQKPYEPKPGRYTEEGDTLGKNVKAYRDASVDEAMRRWRIRNPTALEPTAERFSKGIDTSKPWRKPHKRRGDVTADADLWTRSRSPVASATLGSPVDATQYLSPENRQLMEDATRSNAGSAQSWVSRPEVQFTYATPNFDLPVSASQCQTSFDATPGLNAQTQSFELHHASFQQPSIPFPYPLGFRPATSPLFNDQSVDLPDQTSHFDQEFVPNTLSLSTESPATVSPARLCFVNVGPGDYEQGTAPDTNQCPHPTRNAEYLDRLTGSRDESAQFCLDDPFGEDGHMRRYKARQELLARFPATGSGFQY